MGPTVDSTTLTMSPWGQFFRPDPVTGQYVSPNPPNGVNYPSFNANDFRPLLAYQEFYLLQHTGFAKYNSMQVSWQKQTGPVTFLTNYTFSKALGIWDYTSNNGQSSGDTVDPLNFKSNYGPLAYDHTHILNLVYVWHLPTPIHGNPFLGGAVNGWELLRLHLRCRVAPRFNRTWRKPECPMAGQLVRV